MENEFHYWIIFWLALLLVGLPLFIALLAAKAEQERIRKEERRQREEQMQRPSRILENLPPEIKERFERLPPSYQWAKADIPLEDQERWLEELTKWESKHQQEKLRQQQRDQARQQMEEEWHSKIQGLTEELLQFEWGLKACSHCGELKFYVEEMSPSGKSMKCLCAHCWRPQVVKSRAIDTSRAVDLYNEIKQLLSSHQLSTFQTSRGALMVRVTPSEGAPEPTGREPIPESVRTEVWRRDEGRCVKCGFQENLEFDHIIPYSKGGADTVRNLQLLCQTCNRSKGASI